MNQLPILYSFRRCPYAMRARLALTIAKMPVIIREIDLKNKATEFLEISPKATVPVLLLPSGKIIDESLDIVDYAIPEDTHREQRLALLAQLHKETIPALMRYKYHERYEDVDIAYEQSVICQFFEVLNTLLSESTYLFEDTIGKEDIVILPFVRQIYKIDAQWFDALKYLHVKKWLHAFLDSELHSHIMRKFPVWAPGQEEQITYSLNEKGDLK